MTIYEYEYYFKRMRTKLPFITRKAMKKLASIYEEAGRKVADIIRNTELRNLSELTSGAWRQIEHQLQKEAERLREALRTQVQTTVEAAGDLSTGIQERYLYGIMDKASGRITQSGIVNMFSAVNRKLVTLMVNRVYHDGYTFSERIWQAGVDMQTAIKDVISVSSAMNRDVIDIAKDLEVYLKKGRTGLAKRYGGLVKGTGEWQRRIRKNVDYRALRLVRSELYQSIQDASVISGRMNPGTSGLYDWKRNTSEDWNCECPELAANGPYMIDEVPDYPHPNCLCTVVPRLMNQDEFLADVKAWGKGDSVDYLDQWYRTYYSQSA